MKPIRVLLAEDHTMVREGLRIMLKLEKDIEVIGEAPNGRRAVTLALELRPDVVVMDITMPGLNGVEATRQLLKELPKTKVIILIAEGKANKETASELGVSIKTVERHRGHLMEKLDFHDTAGLTCHAIATGIIESSVQVTIL